MDVFLTVFIIALFLTYIFTPIVKKVAYLLGTFDKPNNRRINTKPIPNIGGLAIFAGFIITVLLFADSGKILTGLITGGSFIFLLGIIDDIYELAPWIKLLGQIIAAGILISFGIKIEFITNPFGGMIYLGYWGIPLSLIWIVGITNTVNLIDGLDGLAAGITVIAVTTLFFVSLQEGQSSVAIFAIALAGSSLGFLRFNFHPAEIFMGDSGAMFSGYVMAAISVAGALKSAAAVTLIVPLLALGVPIFDTLFAIIRRVYHRKPISKADNGHIHHRLLALGWSQTRAVLSVYAISVFLGIMALVVNGSDFQSGIVLLFIAFAVVVYGAWKIGVFSVDIPTEGRALEKSNL